MTAQGISPVRSRAASRKPWIAIAGLILVIIGTLLSRTIAAHPGCKSYTPVDDIELVAHAGGGLPDRSYANNLEALNLAAKHGFKLIELDFLEHDGRLVIGRDAGSPSTLTVAMLTAWLDAHPGISIVTDVKTSDNISGLRILKSEAGPRLARFVPQIYDLREYEGVRALGFPPPIFTIYRLAPDKKWVDAANALPLRAVTMPVAQKRSAAGVRHPVFLHTVNEPIAGFGLYTDCLIPSDPVQA